MHALFCVSSCRLLLCAALLAVAAEGTDVYSEDLTREFERLSRAAAAARQAGKLVEVEQTRDERLEIVKRFAQNQNHDSPLLAAYRALEAVDGTDDKPGLVNTLQYDKAAQILLDAWSAMCAAAPEGPVLGEVATRLFEVIHQKAAVWEGAAAADDAAKPPVDDQSLQAILTAAERLDPCCVGAIPMVEWLKPLDPKESFLRAEVRPSFKARQERLLRVSHPLLKGHASGANTGGAVSPPDGKPATEEGQADAVMPWHAPTEYLKAQSLQLLLNEVETLEDVLQNWYRTTNGAVAYIIPRKPVKGRDANGNRFELLYGRLLLTSVIDRNNRRRPAALLLDTKGRWEQRMLDLLWREPTEQELRDKPELRVARDLVMRLEVLEAWSLGGSDFRLCTYPIHETELLLRSGARLLCLEDALSLSKMKFKHANNESNALAKLLDDRPGEFGTDPAVIRRLYELGEKPDKTLHPLVEVTKQNHMFAVLSRSSRPKSGPSFFVENGKPFLKLQDGGSLFFELDNSPICFRETKYGRLVYPLTGRGIPGTIVVGCGAGKCMAHVLRTAGFSADAAVKAICDWIADETVPEDFVKYVKAKAEAATNGGSQKGRGGKSAVLNVQLLSETVAGMVDDARKSQLGLKCDGGLANHKPVRDELRANFFLFGYRHFYDHRGNIFFSANLRDSQPVLFPDGGYTKIQPGQQSDSLPQHVFAVIQPDGKPIAIDQLFSFDDYVQMSLNRSQEYLIESLLYAPSFGTYGAIVEDELRPFIHPDEKNPLDDGKNKKAKVSSAGAGNSGASREDPQFVQLLSPIPAWFIEDDEKQKETLTNLHNAYVELVSKVAGKLHAAVNGKDQQPADDVGGRFGDRWGWLRKINREPMAESLLAVQLASARRYAKKGCYHRAIVYYNDLLERMPAVELSDPYTLLLTKVPTTDEGRYCVRKLEVRIRELSRLICLQVELAGVLQRAGVSESAFAIFSRVADDVEFFVRPTFGIMKHLLTSYGLQMEQDCDRAIKSLEDKADLASRAIGQFGLRSEWRTLSVAKPAEIVNQMERATRLIELVGKARGRERLTKDESKELEVLRRQDEEDRPKEFRYWLERKKKILENGADGDAFELACRIGPDMGYDVRNGVPLSFVPGAGFQEPRDAVVELINLCKVDNVIEWCLDPLVEANAAPNDLAHAFLLAWYWADRGDNPKARAALMNIATLCRDSAEAAGPATEAGLVHRLNCFRALGCASCLSQTLPGVRGARVDFTDALSLQVLMWEREWLAGGMPPHQAAEQADEIEAMISDARAALGESALSDFSSRYFFPDYTCQFGGVPDYVVREVLDRPDLFKEIKPGEVAGNNVPEAVKDEGDWILVSKGEALGYFARLPARVRLDVIDREVVGVR